MCSTQCDSPVFPGRSFRLPTRYHVQMETIGAVWSSLRMTPSLLFSCVSTTLLDNCGAMTFSLRLKSWAELCCLIRCSARVAFARIRIECRGLGSPRDQGE